MNKHKMTSLFYYFVAFSLFSLPQLFLTPFSLSHERTTDNPHICHTHTHIQCVKASLAHLISVNYSTY